VSDLPRILIVNINPDPRTLEGCEAIASALGAVETRIRPWRTLLDPTGSLAADLRAWQPAAVILGPNDTPFPAYPPAFDRFLSWVRARRGPTLGICGGHQAIALAHGAPVGPVFPVPAATTTYSGMPKVQGVTRVRLLGDPDPLLANLPDEVDVMASHVDEVKDLPPGFRLLALGDPSRIQIFRADRRPLWGVQFHPERPLPEGHTNIAKQILDNFVTFATIRHTEPAPLD
jgi:GMP synthase-like glutamine amidotransferase